jgi:hypothetical protein
LKELSIEKCPGFTLAALEHLLSTSVQGSELELVCYTVEHWAKNTSPDLTLANCKGVYESVAAVRGKDSTPLLNLMEWQLEIHRLEALGEL